MWQTVRGDASMESCFVRPPLAESDTASRLFSGCWREGRSGLWRGEAFRRPGLAVFGQGTGG
jgi:hypothetical protein